MDFACHVMLTPVHPTFVHHTLRVLPESLLQLYETPFFPAIVDLSNYRFKFCILH